MSPTIKHTLQVTALAAGMVVFSTSAQAATYVIDLTTDTTIGTGYLLDDSGGGGANIATSLPVTVAVYHSAQPLGTSQVGTIVPGLSLTVASASSWDSANTVINASGAGFGLNSPTPAGGTENSSRFDVDASEMMTMSFSQAVTIISAEFGSFSGEETFTFGGVTFGNSQYTGGDLPLADGDDIFTFAAGGLDLAATEGFSLQSGGPAGTQVGLVAITIDYIPEPSSTALFGLGGLALVLRRRR